MSGVSLKNVSVTYSGRKALMSVSADFPVGSLSIVIGLNGAGKTTLLKTVAGLVGYDGNVFIRGRLVDEVPPNLRGISYVPQNNALIPSLKVWWNIALGLIDRVRGSRVIEKRVEEVAQALGIRHLLNRYPKELSGGEARRVAIARALAFDSDIVLMDEPELSVDVQTWQIILDAVLKMRRSGKTVMLTTHNFEDLMPYVDVLCLLHEGNALFVGSPANLETENLPSDVRAWLGSVIKVDGLECSEGDFCVVFLDGYGIYAGPRKEHVRKYGKVLVLPKHVTVDQEGLLKGRVIRKIGCHAGRIITVVEINGRELVVTSRETLPDGTTVGLSVGKAIPLGGVY
ncbi:MAG: ABC transporter ATP-binding protein [Zestosphaera sp.]